MQDVAGQVGAGDRGEVDFAAAFKQQTHAQRNMHRLLGALSGRRWHGLLERQGEGLLGRVIGARSGDQRRSGLVVPERELAEISAACLFEAGDEIFDRDGLAVVPVEIEVHALLEQIAAEDRRDHAGDFRALFVDGRRIEVVDFAILRRPHRMGQRAGVLGKLLRLQVPHLGNALDRTRAHVGGKFVVAVNRQAFLEAQLEPVAAGDAVAGPVVEVFVRDDRLDIGVVRIGRRFRIGEHVFVVEDVETLVLHRPHVEVGDGDDHEDVEVVFTAEGIFVPLHRALERVHGVGGAWLLAVLDIDLQRDFAAGHRRERILDDAEIAGDEREEVARLRMRVEPGGEMAAVAHVGAAEIVAVGQQEGSGRLVGDDVDRVDGKHIRTIGEIGDAAEAFGLALGAVDAVGAVKPHQLRVRIRRKQRGDGDFEGCGFR
ncbi:hypothetical protein D9M68_309640 [compost metagenome]